MDRRAFLRKSCVGCLAVAGAGAMASALSSCSTLPVLKTELKQTKLVIDPALLPPDSNVFLLRAKQLDYDVLLVRECPGSYYGLYMQCTHNENSLSPTRSAIYCHTHNAEFDLKGNVKSGPPKDPLKRFKAVEENGAIIVSLK